MKSKRLWFFIGNHCRWMDISFGKRNNPSDIRKCCNTENVSNSPKKNRFLFDERFNQISDSRISYRYMTHLPELNSALLKLLHKNNITPTTTTDPVQFIKISYATSITFNEKMSNKLIQPRCETVILSNLLQRSILNKAKRCTQCAGEWRVWVGRKDTRRKCLATCNNGLHRNRTSTLLTLNCAIRSIVTISSLCAANIYWQSKACDNHPIRNSSR